MEPNFLYKYRAVPLKDKRSMEHLATLITHGRLYCGPAALFNDTYDVRAPISLDATPEIQRADYIRLSKKFDPDLSDEQRELDWKQVQASALSPEGLPITTFAMREQMHVFARQQVGIYCLTEKPDDELMWGHYADGSAGICLQFDVCDPVIGQASPVRYSSELLPVNIFNTDPAESLERMFFTKSAKWAYEREWRFLRGKKGVGEEQLQDDTLKSIIFGPGAHVLVRQKVCEMNEKRTQPAKIFHARRHLDRYALEIPDLPR